MCDVFQCRCADRYLFERGYHHSRLVVDEVWNLPTAKRVCWQGMCPALTLHKLIAVDKMFVFVFVFFINHRSDRHLVIFRFTKRSQNGSKIKARNRLIITLDLRIFGSKDVSWGVLDEMSSPCNSFEGPNGRKMLIMGNVSKNCLWESRTLDYLDRILGSLKRNSGRGWGKRAR